MKKSFNLRYAAYILAAVLLVPLSVASQNKPGFYASVYGGPSATTSTSFSESRTSGPVVGGKVNFGNGIGFGLAVGHRYSNEWSVELALDERGNLLKNVGDVSVDGNIFSEVVFLNGYYRFPARGTVRPFIGAGLATSSEWILTSNETGWSKSTRAKAAWLYKRSRESSTACHPNGL